ncbi:phage-related protein [Paenibacillus cellulosilyticus]|uniref:Phage-related protein n=1 Tax=Paenibacillus cellulosilyticus TaxID=375489 RepID=A0A2V2YP26_9BACL|nr:hypothetical protein [Paenibacillus cellulosilyticus]PWV97435.1 phage-related protein [Paenibacillus cellulosilyticus]QKS48526.1 hypothetical protein HUB94_30290 [Paenibacillus cellulosilyticus]
MSAGSAGRIDLDLGLNFDMFRNQLNGIANIANNMVGGAFKRLGALAGAAFAVDKIVSFGREAINLASDLNEVQNVVDVTFGNMAADINAWSKEALTGFGLSELSAKRYASTLGAMMKSSGLAGSQMEQMSKKLTELSADMASFYNLSNDDAFEKIRSGIAGETEPLMALGINMNVANMEAYALSQGITKSWQSMSQAEQTLLRYNYLLNASKDAQGDFARTSNGWANQTRLLNEQWKIFQGTMGQGFINVLTPVIGWINKLIRYLQVGAEYFKAFTEVIFGSAGQTSSQVTATSDAAAGAVSGMGDASTDAANDVKKASKTIKGALGGFDQLNTISQGTADAMDDVAAGAALAGTSAGVDLGSLGSLTPDIELDPVKAKVQGFVNNVKGMFGGLDGSFKGIGQTIVSTFGPSLTQAWAQIEPQLGNWKAAFGKTFTDIVALGAPLKNWFTTGVVPLWQKEITVLGTIVAGLLDSMLNVFTGLETAAMPVLTWFVTDGLPILSEFLSGAMDIYLSLFDGVKLIFDDLWSGAVEPGLLLFSDRIVDTLNIVKDFWYSWGDKILSGVKNALDGIKGLWSNLWDKFLQPFISNMLENMSWLWEKHLKGLYQEIATFVGKLTTAALDIFNKFIVPVTNYLIDVLGPTFSNIFSLIGDVIGSVLGVIIDVAAGIIKSLGGIVDFIAGVFTGDWKRAWNGIQSFNEGIADSIVGVFKGAVNLIIDAFNFMIRQLNTVSIDMPDWVPGIGGQSFGINIPTIPKLAKGGLAYGPTLAMVGDNKGASVDPEVVSPLSKLQEMLGGTNQVVVDTLMLILDAIKSSDKSAVLQIGETQFGRVAARAINSAQRQSRQPLLEV